MGHSELEQTEEMARMCRPERVFPEQHGPNGQPRFLWRGKKVGEMLLVVDDRAPSSSALIGAEIPEDVREQMNWSLGADFSDVRIHETPLASSLNALACTIGSDVFFAPGCYQPKTLAGRELLGHELAHVLQQRSSTTMHERSKGLFVPARGALELEADRAGFLAARGTRCRFMDTGRHGRHRGIPMLQRKERPNDTATRDLGDGDWLESDRTNMTQRFYDACYYNLENQQPHEYTQPGERAAFYLWFYMYTSVLHYQIRWPLAAYLVATGAAGLSDSSLIENDVQVAARRGNQVIFDDVFPKLWALVNPPAPLVGWRAYQWDLQTLTEEQTLIQGLYNDLPGRTVDAFDTYSRKGGVRGTAGDWLGYDSVPRTTAWSRGGTIPSFTGNIRASADRIAYGLRLATLFSTHPSETVCFPMRMLPGYSDGSLFRGFDNRRHLHELDAELDDTDIDEERVIEIMQAMSPTEQRELGYNAYRLARILEALDEEEERRQALDGLRSLPADVRAKLLR